MGYVSTWIFGTEIELLDADVLDCMRFFGCSYDDALYHLAYAEYRERVGLDDNEEKY